MDCGLNPVEFLSQHPGRAGLHPPSARKKGRIRRLSKLSGSAPLSTCPQHQQPTPTTLTRPARLTTLAVLARLPRAAAIRVRARRPTCARWMVEPEGTPTRRDRLAMPRNRGSRQPEFGLAVAGLRGGSGLDARYRVSASYLVRCSAEAGIRVLPNFRPQALALASTCLCSAGATWT